MDSENIVQKPLLIMMVGLPYCGKSERSSAMGCPVVNPDAIRQALYGAPYFANGEEFVWATAKTMVRALFYTGEPTVVLDATNVQKEWRARWIDDEWELVFLPVLTPADVCIERARNAGDMRIIPVIEQMVREYEPVSEEEGLIYTGVDTGTGLEVKYLLPATAGGSRIPEQTGGRVFVGNAFSMKMIKEGLNAFTRKITRDDAVRMVRQAGQRSQGESQYLINTLGHQNIADIATKMLGHEFGVNRISVTMEEGDRLVVVQYTGDRLPEGATTLPPGFETKIDWFMVEVTSKNIAAMVRAHLG